jgi:hypothetical protein
VLLERAEAAAEGSCGSSLRVIAVLAVQLVLFEPLKKQRIEKRLQARKGLVELHFRALHELCEECVASPSKCSDSSSSPWTPKMGKLMPEAHFASSKKPSKRARWLSSAADTRELHSTTERTAGRLAWRFTTGKAAAALDGDMDIVLTVAATRRTTAQGKLRQQTSADVAAMDTHSVGATRFD